jgi:hypothetical protein
VAKSMVAELSDETNIAQAYALVVSVWSLGSSLGCVPSCSVCYLAYNGSSPFMGGALARPHETFPKIFGTPFWKEYPYFLPCLVAALWSFSAFLLALFFLKEVSFLI